MLLLRVISKNLSIQLIFQKKLRRLEEKSLNTKAIMMVAILISMVITTETGLITIVIIIKSKNKIAVDISLVLLKIIIIEIIV